MEAGPSAVRLQFGDATLVRDERLLLRNGQPVSLTPKAFDLLLVLVENAGRLLSKEQLMQALWGDTAVEESNLSYYVFAIRKALGDTAENSQLIETVPKHGYRFTATVTRVNGNGAGPAPAETHPDRRIASIPLTSRRRPLRFGRTAAWFSAGVLVTAGVGFLVTWTRDASPPVLVRAQVSPDVQLAEASPFALSPDGLKLIFAGRGSDGVTRLWVRSMSDESSRPLTGTETALGGLTPPMFWSPDSRFAAFDAAGQLKRVDLRDGATRTLCSLPGLAVGGSWNAAGVIVVGQPNAGLFVCSPDGKASELTRLGRNVGETAHVFPWFLPDGRHFLYVRAARQAPEGSGVYVGSLDDSPDAARPRRLLATGFGAAYVPTQGTAAGHVVFLRDETLFAQRFDERTLQLRGNAFPLASPVGSFIDGGFFAASHNDVIAYRPPNNDFQLTWFDRDGRTVGTVGEIGRYSRLTISPDDSRIAVARETIGASIDQDIWMLEASSQAKMRVTFSSLLEDSPVWSADSRHLFYGLDGDVGTLFEQVVEGAAPPRALLPPRSHPHKLPTSVSPDGRHLLYTATNMDPSGTDLWALPLHGGGTPFPLVERAFEQVDGRFSPDGLWVAYASNESGRYEVFVRSFNEPSDPRGSAPETVPVSTGGGTAPRWHARGKELYFIAPDGRVMAADVRMGPPFSTGVPRELFRLTGSHGDWDVNAAGSRFLIAIPSGSNSSAPFTILWNRLAQSAVGN